MLDVERVVGDFECVLFCACVLECAEFAFARCSQVSLAQQLLAVGLPSCRTFLTRSSDSVSVDRIDAFLPAVSYSEAGHDHAHECVILLAVSGRVFCSASAFVATDFVWIRITILVDRQPTHSVLEGCRILMDLNDGNSVRHIRVALKKTIGIIYKVMERQQRAPTYDVPIRELSHSLKSLRSILHDFYCRNTAAPRQALSTAGALVDIKSLLHEINQFFETSPTKVQDVITCHDELYEFHRRIVEKILVFQNASLNGELSMTQSLLLTVGILSPQMPSLHGGSGDGEHEQQLQLMSERKVANSVKDGSDALLFMSFQVDEGLFVGYYTYNHEPLMGGAAGLTRLILRFDLKMKILREQEEEDGGSGFTGHFRVEMSQLDNELHTASVRNYSFVKTYKAGEFPWQDPLDPELRRRRLCVQKWQFGGEWRDRNLDMDCAECLGNVLHDELDRDPVDLEGEWYGFYFMGREPQPSDLPFQLKMQTLRTSEGVINVTGEGTDEHGMFDIRGRLIQDALLKKLEFRKIYFFHDFLGTRVDRFGWDYKGLIEAGGRGVTGTWGVGSRPQGTFSMARVD